MSRLRRFLSRRKESKKHEKILEGREEHITVKKITYDGILDIRWIIPSGFMGEEIEVFEDEMQNLEINYKEDKNNVDIS